MPPNTQHNKKVQRRRFLKKLRPSFGSGARSAVQSLVLFSVMASIPWLGHATWRYLSQSQFFAVETVEVQGNTILQDKDVQAVVHAVGGGNVLQIKKDAIRSALIETGWVRSVSIHRDLPNTITVHVREYEPVATIMLDRMYLLDKTGRVFRAVRPGDPIVRPLLTGFTNPSNAYEKRILQRSLTLKEIYGASRLNEFDEVALIHHDAAKGYTLITEQNRIVINLGHDHFPKRIQKIRFVIRDSIQRTGTAPKMVHADLDNNQVVVLPDTQKSRVYGHTAKARKTRTAGPAAKQSKSKPRRVVQR